MRQRVQYTDSDTDRFSLETVLVEVAEVYRRAFATTSLPPSDADVERFRDETLPRHRTRDGFRFVLAREDERLVGFAYGYTGATGQYWSDWIRDSIPAELAAEWLEDNFEVCELCVDPDDHRRGIGGRLLDLLLDGLPNRRALLTTQRGETPALALYRSRGWQVVWEAIDERFALLGRTLNISQLNLPG